jgi:Protein kinase domain/AAA ATPase domain
MKPTHDPAAAAVWETSGHVVKQRYEVLEAVGRGGVAVVYKARDLARNRLIALKRLVPPASESQRVLLLELFEREYRTLAELAHPSIVAVYDYIVDEESVFYTMELVEGIDLNARTTWPWRQVCELMAQICSALSLVHSRGMIHRDITPRNVRCSETGRAKLIDFGAMTPMGLAKEVVGTPAFMAPEVLEQASLDARTDLFALGATMYFALTGRLAFSASDVRQLRKLWHTPLDLPSNFASDLPDALDRLVMSLLSVAPALRPRTAAEVMQRLLSIAGVGSDESPEVSRSYLTAPVLVGREKQLAAIREQMREALSGRRQSLLISAAPGLGRSRLLDACVLEFKVKGATMLRASAASLGDEAFGVAQSLAEQLVNQLGQAALQDATPADLQGLLFEAALPALKLRVFKRADNAYAVVTALAGWIELVASRMPLAIVVDDVERIDPQSGQWLARLARPDRFARLMLLSSIESSSAPPAAAARRYELGPLGRAETRALFLSVFGDVPNLVLVSDGIFGMSGGSPRVALATAQCLVDNGSIDYTAGVWRLPSTLDALALPGSAEDAIAKQLDALSPLAQQLVEAQALASHPSFTSEEYARLASTDVERALLELVSRQVLNRTDDHFMFSHRGWAATSIRRCDDASLRDRHRALARLYDHHLGVEPVFHMLEAGLVDEAIDRLIARVRATTGRELHEQSRMTGAHLASIMERALNAAIERKRPAREIHDLRRGICAFVAVITSEEVFYRVAPAWLEQLKRDSGFVFWVQDTTAEPALRLANALQRAAAQYESTPLRDRVYKVDEAVRGLIGYVVFSIAIAARTQDLDLVETLPDLMEPFTGLSRVAAVIQDNARAGRELRCFCRPERARVLWTHVYEELGNISVAELPNLQVIRNAVAAGIGSVEALMGLSSSAAWAELIEKDPFQTVHAFHLRKVVRLQHGEWEAAEAIRKQAEEVAAVSFGRQMFFNSTFIELEVYALTEDLLGARQIIDRWESLASRFSGWAPWLHLAHAIHHRIRGENVAARVQYERCLSAADAGKNQNHWLTRMPRGAYWPMSVAGYLEVLVALGEAQQASLIGRELLRICEERDIRVLSHGMARSVALAEAKLGEYAAAAERIEHVIAEQTQYGVSGVHLGASYEARTRIAIWAADYEAIEKFGRLTATVYRHGLDSPLGVRYERLLNEGRRVAPKLLPALADVPNSQLSADTALDTDATVVIEQLVAAPKPPSQS